MKNAVRCRQVVVDASCCLCLGLCGVDVSWTPTVDCPLQLLYACLTCDHACSHVQLYRGLACVNVTFSLDAHSYDGPCLVCCYVTDLIREAAMRTSCLFGKTLRPSSWLPASSTRT